jgi:hypothetical protein
MMAGNRYLAHALMRYIGQTGANCAFESHQQFAPTEWEYCTLMDLDQGVSLMQQGLDPDQADQQLWDTACQKQDQFGTPCFYQNIYCCKACALKTLIAHTNDQHLARSMLAFAQAKNVALLLLSDRLDQRPLVAANIPIKIRPADIWPLLQSELKVM